MRPLQKSKPINNLGADAVGMSTIPEAILSHATGLKVVALSCITNYAAGISDTELTHEEVTDTSQKTIPWMQSILSAFWQKMGEMSQLLLVISC